MMFVNKKCYPQKSFSLMSVHTTPSYPEFAKKHFFRLLHSHTVIEFIIKGIEKRRKNYEYKKQ